MGSAATVASGNLTVRLMTVSNTVSPNASTTLAMTSRAWRVRPSNIVARMPSIVSDGLRRSCTFSIVSTSSATPRSAKNSVSSGMMTPCAAVSALTVSRPRDGWQSTRITSYSSDTFASARASTCSRATSPTSWISAADRSMFAGMTSMSATAVWWITSCGSRRPFMSTL